MFALGISYLTGYATATSAGRREKAEWPPHPGRIFMAMVAALYETKPLPGDAPALADWSQEYGMLEWLESLDPPSLKVSDADERLPVTCYVPVNDKPSWPANRQPRLFPKVRPHNPEVFLLWPDVSPTATQRKSINRLCQKVIRVGHSSSLVQMWVVPEGHELQPDLVPLAPSEHSEDVAQLRVTSAGCLHYLQQQFRGEEIDRFFDLSANIETAKGKARKAAEAEFEQVFGVKWTRSLQAPVRLRPMLSVTRAYVRLAIASPEPTASTCFDPKLLVLSKNEGPSLGLEATAQLLDALRGAILKNCPGAIEWITGHRPDGLPSERPHVALMPLSFVGAEHADGHLLGLALAFPRAVSARERARALGRFLYSSTGDPAEITLTLGRLGVWTLQQEQRPAPPRALRTETWTRASCTWASVTPVVLNRHPKADREEDRVAWFNEIAATVAESCEHIGLPKPVEIDIDKASWHRGAPRAKPGTGGFPLLPGKPGAPPRQQVHVWLRFAQPVEGPLLIGAGRYRGYGLCKPWEEATS